MKQYECGFGTKRVDVGFHTHYAVCADTPEAITYKLDLLKDSLRQRFEFTHRNTGAIWSFDVKKIHVYSITKKYTVAEGREKVSLTVPPDISFNIALEGRCALHTEGKASCPDDACQYLRAALDRAIPGSIGINFFEVIK